MKTPNMRKTVNHTFFWIFVYNIAGFAFVTANVPNGLESILGVTFGNLILLIPEFMKKYRVKPVFTTGKKMTGKSFLFCFCLLCIAQSIDMVLQLLWEHLGITGTQIDINIAASGPWFVLYGALIGPIAEELVYRFFAIENMRKHSTGLAIVFSAIAFGAMHMNLTQSIFALLVGTILAYIYLEYGILWSVIFHIFNNFVLATLPIMIFGETEIVDKTLCGIFFAAGIIGLYLLYIKRNEVGAWIKAQFATTEKGSLVKCLTSVWFWLFMLYCISFIVLFITHPEILNQANQQLG